MNQYSQLKKKTLPGSIPVTKLLHPQTGNKVLGACWTDGRACKELTENRKWGGGGGQKKQSECR
jgi:hypothetical protein